MGRRYLRREERSQPVRAATSSRREGRRIGPSTSRAARGRLTSRWRLPASRMAGSTAALGKDAALRCPRVTVGQHQRPADGRRDGTRMPTRSRRRTSRRSTSSPTTMVDARSLTARKQRDRGADWRCTVVRRSPGRPAARSTVDDRGHLEVQLPTNPKNYAGCRGTVTCSRDGDSRWRSPRGRHRYAGLDGADAHRLAAEAPSIGSPAGDPVPRARARPSLRRAAQTIELPPTTIDRIIEVVRQALRPSSSAVVREPNSKIAGRGARACDQDVGERSCADLDR